MKLAFENIVLKSSTIKELNELDNIYKEACDYFKFDINHEIIHPKICIEEGDLPPNGSKDKFEILSCYINEILSGYITVYKGYHDDTTIYICFIYLVDLVKGQGVGNKIINYLCKVFKKDGFSNIKLSVSLKNWDGLKFWNKCGFDKISLIDCEGHFSKNNYGCIELTKDIQY